MHTIFITPPWQQRQGEAGEFGYRANVTVPKRASSTDDAAHVAARRYVDTLPGAQLWVPDRQMAEGWVFFVDLDPAASWSHAAQYIVWKDGAFVVRPTNRPPPSRLCDTRFVLDNRVIVPLG